MGSSPASPRSMPPWKPRAAHRREGAAVGGFDWPLRAARGRSVGEEMGGARPRHRRTRAGIEEERWATSQVCPREPIAAPGRSTQRVSPHDNPFSGSRHVEGRVREEHGNGRAILPREVPIDLLGRGESHGQSGLESRAWHRAPASTMLARTPEWAVRMARLKGARGSGKQIFDGSISEACTEAAAMTDLPATLRAKLATRLPRRGTERRASTTHVEASPRRATGRTWRRLSSCGSGSPRRTPPPS